ncbi:MAG: NUDIX domain-containing protein [Candidatus Diapherotrites archaeon]
MSIKSLVAILIVKDKCVLAEVRKSNDPFGAGCTWIPGGHVEPNETEERAFLRETKEELDIEPLNYYALCSFPWEKDKKQYTVQYFVCTKWKGKIKKKEAAELIWISQKEIEKLDEEVDRQAFKKYLEKM